MSGTEILRMENISKDFFGNQVLSGVNFTLGKGEILGLVGENGAGKSTLMKILFGMPAIHSTGGYQGKIILNGKEINFKNPQEALDNGIGMVHQEFSLIPGFTVAENIVLNREPLKKSIFQKIFGEEICLLDRKEISEIAKKAIKELNVELNQETVTSELPVGYKQFTEIAREIGCLDTKILVLDEPTAVLTESEADILLKAMRALADKGISIIFITHRLGEIITVADNIIVLRDGQIIQETPVKNTNIRQIAEWMVGRKVGDQQKSTKAVDAEGEEILQVENLWVDMPGETVRDVTFSVKKGEIYGIGGLAGQGKLGIPNGVMGLFEAGGEVLLNNKSVVLNQPAKALQTGMAFVSEDRRGVGLLLDESIEWNIGFTAMQVQNKFVKKPFGNLIKWRDDKALEKSAAEYISALSIKCVNGKQLVKELSGGNQQKICLAKAFAVQPDLLFVSEPTRGIDIGAKKLVLDTLKKYNEEYGTTIVMISSELEELRSICNRIAIISEGKVAGVLPSTAEATEFGLLMLGK